MTCRPRCSQHALPLSNKHNSTYGTVDAALAVTSKNGYVGAVLKNLRGGDNEADIDIPHWAEDDSECPHVPKYTLTSPPAVVFGPVRRVFK